MVKHRIANPTGKADAAWLCECKCGNIIGAQTPELRAGAKLSCGCTPKSQIEFTPPAAKKNTVNIDTDISEEIPIGNAKNIIGEQRGGLTVLTRVKPPEGKNPNVVYWKCRCLCGKEIIRTWTKGRLHFYGCEDCQKTHRDDPRYEYEPDYNRKYEPGVDMTGQKIGKLQVLECDKRGSIENDRHGAKWWCLCDCGAIVSVEQRNLAKHNHTLSCGCTDSNGELNINKLLIEANIPFEREKTFEGLGSSEKGRYRFDFFVNGKYLIEFDGEQHYDIVKNFGGAEALKRTQYRDAQKNKYCEEHNIPLIRIPYTLRYTMKLEDLLLETTKYRVV